jgi:hypothetical protein
MGVVSNYLRPDFVADTKKPLNLDPLECVPERLWKQEEPCQNFLSQRNRHEYLRCAMSVPEPREPNFYLFK